MPKRRRPNGWQLKNRQMEPKYLAPPGESRWEKMLQDLQIDEENILRILRERNDRTRVLRMWVMANAQIAYVPEAVLKAVGME